MIIIRSMGLKIDEDKAISLIGYTGKFKNHLKTVIQMMENDDTIDSIKKAAYLLATASVESGYSLSRWEADYACGKYGVPYDGKPCQKAMDYYASEKGKQNYFNLGTDSNGVPYIGRGLIQLTGKSNYKLYGDTIGVDLVKNPDEALKPETSYKIASAYMNKHKKNGKTTFEWVEAGDLTNARKTVNGGNKSLNEVNTAYKKWVDVLTKTAKVTPKKLKIQEGLSLGLIMIVASATLGLYYVTMKFKTMGL
jgi:predicted chitinase